MQQKSAPPPRPATQPTRLSASTLAKEKEAKELERGERMKLAREKIAQDLVKSEMQFVADLRACEGAIRADNSDLLDKGRAACRLSRRHRTGRQSAQRARE